MRDYAAVNGYSNRYYGWGGEDDVSEPQTINVVCKKKIVGYGNKNIIAKLHN